MELYFRVHFHNDEPGCAGADTELCVPTGVAALLSWGDEKGEPLEHYLPIRLLPLVEGKASYRLRDGLMIPEEARTLVCRVYNDFGHEIKLKELCYPLPDEKRTVREEPETVYYVTSDIHVGGRYFQNDRNRETAFAHIAADKPCAVLISGDITDNSYPEEFAEARVLLEKYFADTPIFICSGNHDYSPYKPGATPHFEEMHDFFTWECTHAEANGARCADLNEKNYFEARLANGTQVLVLNANDVGNHFELGETQRAWLERKLCESDGERVRFVLTHFHQKSTVGCSAARFGNQFVIDDAELSEILARHSGIVHVSGHTHFNFDSDMPNAYFDEEHRNLYLNAGCAVWNGVDLEERGEFYLQDRSTGQRVEVYKDRIVARGVDFVSGKFVPRCVSRVNL